ncbi:MAG: glycoside hydrolase family 9 protein [Firmicutes bacterium]|nr:glycoside hydrolase family 9 protein [Bacillota bacterium]
MNLKKSRALILAFMLAALFVFIVGVQAAPPAGWAKLQDLNVFTTENPTGWAGGDGLETPNGYQIPVDYDVTYNGLPSLRINVTNNPSWWWVAMLVWRGWGTTTLEAYYENGALEFNVKGATGGENFNITLQDRANERYINGQLTETVGKTVPLSNFATVTTEWQHVSIPLKSLIDLNSGFILTQAWYLRLTNAGTTSMKLWLNDIKFTSPDNEKSYPAIKVNQVGYLPLGEKYALVTGFDGMLKAAAGTGFQVKRASDGKTVYSGVLTLVSDYEPVASGERVLKANFSRLMIPGTYYISVNAEGIEDSPTFKIGLDVYSPLLVDAARYYYYQRANLKLEPQYAGDFPRDDRTPIDFNAPFESNSALTKDVSGGWYDAGDFGKYVSAGATAVSDLLWAYETVPFVFKDGQLNIPESGNGIPDILDEVRYELDFFLKMQDVDGGFYSRIYQENPRMISDVVNGASNVKPTAHTASTVAALANAAIVFKRINSVYAASLLEAARKGWAYLEAHPEMVATPGGPYYDDNDQDDRFWAAGTLYRATGEAKYNAYVKANYQAFASTFDQPENAHHVNDMEIFGYFNYLKGACPDKEVAAWFKSKFANWTKVQIDRVKNDPWHNTLHNNYYWGSNMPALNVSMDLILGNLLLKQFNPDILKVVQGNFNYVLGLNPLCFSYVSGYGKYCPVKIFSGIYSFDGKPGTPKGYLAGGANQYEGRWFSRFGAKCYVDCDTEWTSNEHTIYWNSSLVFNAAVLSVASNLGLGF